MLILAEGGFSSGLFEEIKKRILKSVENGKRTFLIVPEQQTVIAEAEMTDYLPSGAPLIFEATNFTRFTNTLFRELGGLAGEYSDGTKKLLFVWRALSECAPLLSFGRGEINAGIAQRYFSAINEVQSFGISEEELSEASELDEISKSARLKEKLSELSLVMGAYKRLLHERYADSADDLTEAIKRLRENPEHLKNAEIYIDGFTSFTEGQYKLIGELAKRCTLTVSLTLPKAGADAFEYSEISAAASRILSATDRAGVDKKLIKLDGAFGKSHELLYELVNNIWRFNAKIDNSALQNTDVTRIFSCRTPFEMCDFVCADIKRRVAMGERYSDFAIVARDAASYSGILDLSLRKYKIPAFTSYKRPLDGFAAVKLIFAAYSATDGMRREDVMAYAKCGFTELSRDELDELEAYVNKWQIDGSRFLDEDDWHMNPMGYENRPPKDMPEILARINAARRTLISPLSELKESVRSCKTVKEHALALTEFLISIKLDESLYERAKALFASGDYESAAELGRLWQIICEALDTLVSAVGDFAASPSAFLSQLRLVLSKSEIGRIPSYVDEVTVGSADMLRLYGKRHVYLIGVNEGEFPATVKESSFFGDADRQKLQLAGINIGAESEISAARELFSFSRALSYASESVTLLYTRSDVSFKAAAPSEAIERIVNMTDGKVAPTELSSLPLSDRIYTPEAGAEHLGELTGDSYDALREALIEEGCENLVRVGESRIENDAMQLSKELTSKEYSSVLPLSQSRIDTFLSCPLNYFCKYNLALSDGAPAEFNSASVGSFIHAILENFFRELKVRGIGVAELSEEEKRAITERAARDYLSSIADGIAEGGARMKIRIKRLCRAAAPVVDGLCDEFSDCSFVPAFFELNIKDGNDNLPSAPSILTEDGKETKIYGAIDRVDVYKRGSDVYVRVVDYKTGKKVFKPENLEKGENLQMFLYLKAITESKSQGFKDALGVGDGGEIKPAGVIYVSTAVGDTTVKRYSDEEAEKEVKKQQKRQGMILDDSEIINAMNTKFIPVTFKKGEIDEASKKYLFSMEGYGDIMATLEETVADISKRIRSGEICASPKKDSSGRDTCEWCEFKPICRRHSYG